MQKLTLFIALTLAIPMSTAVLAQQQDYGAPQGYGNANGQYQQQPQYYGNPQGAPMGAPMGGAGQYPQQSFGGAYGGSQGYQHAPMQPNGSAPASYPGYGNMQAQGNAPPKKPSAQQSAQVYHWFLQYDEIRRRAQMNPIERQQADGLLARGFSILMPGQDKIAAKQLLTNLVSKYHNATQAIKALPVIPETKQLQLAYYQYFETAMNLFADYLKVQDNIFAVDSTGQAIAKQLLQRKMGLEGLEQSCKNLDGQVRQHFGVAAYQY